MSRFSATNIIIRKIPLKKFVTPLKKEYRNFQVLIMKEKQVESCLSCKVISISCFLSIGAYLFYHGKKQPQSSKYIFYSLATGSAALGMGEVFNKSPFRDSPNKHQ